jgi:hypothetical protein
MILYGFYKLQLKALKAIRNLFTQAPGQFPTFTDLPSDCTKHLGSFRGLAM